MEQDRDWATRFTADIGKRIEYYRKRAGDGIGMTVLQLADRCAELGLPLDRSVIAKLEKGIRHNISVAELIILARALRVPPTLLVFPLGHQENVEVHPGHVTNTWEVVKWFDGEQAFALADEAGWHHYGPEYDEWHQNAATLGDYRAHEQHVNAWKNSLRRSIAQQSIANTAPGEPERELNLHASQQEEERMRVIETMLKRLRVDMRRRGLTPPPLDELLAHVDDERRRIRTADSRSGE